MEAKATVSVLFVCLGNICRSPTAEAVFRALCQREGLEGRIRIDSAGTGAWHIGEAPDRRAQAAARQRGVDLSALRARTVVAEDFQDFDYLLAMDQDNLDALEALRPAGFSGQLGLFLAYAPQCGETAVPDPYYGGEDGFGRVLDLVEEASAGLLSELRAVLAAQP